MHGGMGIHEVSKVILKGKKPMQEKTGIAVNGRGIGLSRRLCRIKGRRGNISFRGWCFSMILT